MTTRKTLLTLALAAAGAAAALNASAAAYNPDNDSAAFFTYNAARAASAKVAAAIPHRGDVSGSGQYVYSAGDRGWVAREHSYEVVAKQFMHTADCLPYNAPKPIAAIVAPVRTGAFADHGR